MRLEVPGFRCWLWSVLALWPWAAGSLSLVFSLEPLCIGGIDFLAAGCPGTGGQPVTAQIPRLWWRAAVGRAALRPWDTCDTYRLAQQTPTGPATSVPQKPKPRVMSSRAPGPGSRLLEFGPSWELEKLGSSFLDKADGSRGCFAKEACCTAGFGAGLDGQAKSWGLTLRLCPASLQPPLL